jgi:hypothetical protein
MKTISVVATYIEIECSGFGTSIEGQSNWTWAKKDD